MDLKTLTDEELQQHRVAVLTECERRQQLAEIPEQINDLARTYTAGGGDPATLAAAITPDVNLGVSGTPVLDVSVDETVERPLIE